jgi:hypothetical protein
VGYSDPSKFTIVRRNKDDHTDIQVKLYGKEHIKTFNFNNPTKVSKLNAWRRQYVRRQCGNIQQSRHPWTIRDHDELQSLVEAAVNSGEVINWNKIASDLNTTLEGVHQPAGSPLAQSIVVGKKGSHPKKFQLTASTVSRRHRLGSLRTAIGCSNQAKKFPKIREILRLAGALPEATESDSDLEDEDDSGVTGGSGEKADSSGKSKEVATTKSFKQASPQKHNFKGKGKRLTTRKVVKSDSDENLEATDDAAGNVKNNMNDYDNSDGDEDMGGMFIA